MFHFRNEAFSKSKKTIASKKTIDIKEIAQIHKTGDLMFSQDVEFAFPYDSSKNVG